MKENGKKWKAVSIGGVTGIMIGASTSFAATQQFKEETLSDELQGESLVETEVKTEESNPEGTEVVPPTSTNESVSFGQAFSTARRELGVGGVFEWNGNKYTTYTEDEWAQLKEQDKEQLIAGTNDAKADAPEPNGSNLDEPIEVGALVNEPEPNGSNLDEPIEVGALVNEPEPNGSNLDEPIEVGALVNEPEPNGSNFDEPIDGESLANEPEPNGSNLDEPIEGGILANEPNSNGSALGDPIEEPITADNDEPISDGELVDNPEVRFLGENPEEIIDGGVLVDTPNDDETLAEVLNDGEILVEVPNDGETYEVYASVDTEEDLSETSSLIQDSLHTLADENNNIPTSESIEDVVMNDDDTMIDIGSDIDNAIIV
jgi:hypothetical protein